MLPSVLTSLGEFLARPVGRATAADNLLIWYRTPAQLLIVVWGRPTLEDAGFLARAAEVTLAPGVPPRESLMDLRGVDHLAPAAWAAFASSIWTRQTRYAEIVRRFALLVRPDDWHIRALAEGFPRLLASPLSSALHLDPEAALEWLGWREPGLLGEIDQLRSQARGEGSVLSELRRELAERGAGRDLGDVARSLGRSGRTLQRQLRSLGTTFQAEVLRLRVARAQVMLASTDAKIETVAAELGYARPGHFTAVFRRLTGMTPGEWRTRDRGTGKGGS